MRTISEITEKHSTSRPIFQGKLTASGDVRFEVMDKYNPEPQTSDPVENLACSMFNETFNLCQKRFNKDNYERKVMEEILYKILSIYSANSGLKNPQQSKMYKFVKYDLTNLVSRYENVSEGMISLYRYIYPNQLENKILNDAHKANFLAILEKLRSNNEPKLR